MPYLAPTVDNVDPLLVLAIAPGFYLHHVGVANLDPAIGSL